MFELKIFALIIGTEILNRRREDKHFLFLSKTLQERGYQLSGSFIIEDDPALIVQTIKFIASQPNSIILSFGGIGSTPDDYTRKCASIALRDGKLPVHQEAKDTIEKKLGKQAYPHPIIMAELPKGAKLIENGFNGMPAFSLDDRYYFMPGFPEMSHPMVEDILKRLIPEKKLYYRHNLTAICKESVLIEIMKQMPKDVEFSSLPKVYDDGWRVSISVASYNKLNAKNSFNKYITFLDANSIKYTLFDELNN